MPNSRKSFDQVKGILAKLDRSIDSARERRLSDDRGEAVIGRNAEGEEGLPPRARPMRRESVFKSPAEPSTRRGEAWRSGEGR